MARRYVHVYESLLTSGTLPACPPAMES
jgi:hypothetical protein